MAKTLLQRGKDNIALLMSSTCNRPILSLVLSLVFASSAHCFLITMPLSSPASVIHFLDDATPSDANTDTRAFPSDPNATQGRSELIRVAVLGTGMMGQVNAN